MRRHTTAALLGASLLLTLTACSSGSSGPDRHTTYVTEAPTIEALEPDSRTRAAYVAALNAIDTDIVHGKASTAITRGLNQCQSIKQKYGQTELVDFTNSRFTSPDHPNGHGHAKAEKILAVVHTHLCPTF